MTRGTLPETQAVENRAITRRHWYSPDAVNEPLRLGPYELVDRLATGGMAEVFLARREGPHGFQKLMAVKRILPQFSSDQEFVAMFIDEARVCAQLSHPNIVQVFDFGESEGDLYMAMEYVQGTTVAKVIRGAKKKGFTVPLEVSLYIALGVLRGLDYAHRAVGDDGQPLQIVHRDVSPGNVLVDMTGAVKLTDFGIARCAECERRTDVGQLKGKLGYMSPEQVLGQELDPRSDLFTLGIILAELVTLKPLFWAPKELDILMKIRDADVRSLDQADIDPEIRHILKRALARDRNERFASAHEFGVAIENVIQRKRLQAAPSQLSGFLGRLTGSLQSEPNQPAIRIDTPGEMYPPAAPVEHPTKLDSELTYTVEAEATSDPRRSLPGEIGPLSFSQLVELVATGQVSNTARIAKGAGPFRSAQEYPELAKFLGSARIRWEGSDVDLVPIDQLDFAARLLRLTHERWSGSITLVQGPRRKRIYMVNGGPELITSTMKDELLGEFLVRKGHVLRMEIDMALAMLPKFDGRLGDALVGLGMLRPVELFRSIQEQMQTRFMDAFTWTSGRVAITDRQRAPEDTFPLGILGVELVVGSIRNAYSASDLATLLTPFLEGRVGIIKEPRVPRAEMRLSEREEYALRKIDETATLGGWRKRLMDKGLTETEFLYAVFFGFLSGAFESEAWFERVPACAPDSKSESMLPPVRSTRP